MRYSLGVSKKRHPFILPGDANSLLPISAKMECYSWEYSFLISPGNCQPAISYRLICIEKCQILVTYRKYAISWGSRASIDLAKLWKKPGNFQQAKTATRLILNLNPHCCSNKITDHKTKGCHSQAQPCHLKKACSKRLVFGDRDVVVKHRNN